MPLANNGHAVWSGDTVAIYTSYRERLAQLAAFPLSTPRDTPDRTLHRNGWHRTSEWRDADGSRHAELERWAP